MTRTECAPARNIRIWLPSMSTKGSFPPVDDAPVPTIERTQSTAARRAASSRCRSRVRARPRRRRVVLAGVGEVHEPLPSRGQELTTR